MSSVSTAFKAAALLAVSACGVTPGHWNAHTFDGVESGHMGSTEFGAATTHNAAVMTGAAGLTNKFGADVQSTVTFAFGSSTLSAEAKQILQQQASWMRQFPELRFRVYGHTDLVGSSRSNQALGLRRAQAVVRYLASLGVSTSRVDAVISQGETQPLIVTQGREQRNRRTVTEVVGHVSGRDDDLNGEYARLIHRNYVQSATTEGAEGGEAATE